MERKYPDQLGRLVEFNFPPQRIISLVPSQTELLFYLGMNDRVVGITKFCVHPQEWFSSKAKIGGTKKFDFEIIDQLRPDLIIGNKEENYADGIDRLASNYPVWMSDISDWKSAMTMIESIGDLTGEETRVKNLVEDIREKFNWIEIGRMIKTVYLIWKDPLMAVGRNTFIDVMLSKAGLQNLMTSERYPELSLAEIVALSPEVLLLSSEPYPFKQKHVDELRDALPLTKILLVDGEMFSWYGSRLLLAPAYFANLRQLIET
jgi:ABC-type Fe3+-hydroxamate transport system substrate-binding protein